MDALSTLSQIVAKFRKASPNIAAAFDEVERRLDALEQQPAPVPAFGADLFDGFEWAQQEPAGPVVPVASTTELRAAVTQPGAVVDGGGRSFQLGGQLSLPDHGVELTTLRNMTLSGGRVRHTYGKWRLRKVTVQAPPVAEEDCVKGDGGGYLDIDQCVLAAAPRQGILLAPHTDVVVRNTVVRDNGTDASKDHGIYTAAGSRLLIFNSVFRNNRAYQLHFYPAYRDIRVVCSTLEGGLGSIVSGVSNVQIVGCVFRGSSRYGLEQYGSVSNVAVEYCLGDSNQLGGYSVPGAVVRGWQNGGSPKGIIPEGRWGLVPSTDIDGRPRVTADAGAYAT